MTALEARFMSEELVTDFKERERKMLSLHDKKHSLHEIRRKASALYNWTLLEDAVISEEMKKEETK